MPTPRKKKTNEEKLETEPKIKRPKSPVKRKRIKKTIKPVVEPEVLEQNFEEPTPVEMPEEFFPPQKMEINEERETVVEDSKPKKKERNSLIFYLIIFIVAIVILVVSILDLTYFSKQETKQVNQTAVKNIVTINDQMVIPDTKNITNIGARTLSKSGTEVSLSLNNEFVDKEAVFTLKNAYNLALTEVQKWSNDNKLVSIKSLGTILPNGKSSEWQIIFGSKVKKSDYEVITFTDQVVSSKEINSNISGFDLPLNWYDSSDALLSLQNLPQFSDVTISSINFYYNTDGKVWSYAVLTSKGATSMVVR